MTTPVARIVAALRKETGKLSVEKAVEIVENGLKEDIHSALPVSRMLTVSSSHVAFDTFEKMSLDGIRNEIRLPIYSKTSPDNGENYGLLVYLEPGLIDWERIPEDLAAVVKFSLSHNCDILCLDSDGMELEELLIYEWEE